MRLTQQQNAAVLSVALLVQDICAIRSMQLGGRHPSVGDAFFVSALALIYMQDLDRARENLEQAGQIYPVTDVNRTALVEEASAHIQRLEAKRAI